MAPAFLDIYEVALFSFGYAQKQSLIAQHVATALKLVVYIFKYTLYFFNHSDYYLNNLMMDHS